LNRPPTQQQPPKGLRNGVRYPSPGMQLLPVGTVVLVEPRQRAPGDHGRETAVEMGVEGSQTLVLGRAEINLGLGVRVARA